VTEDDSGAWRPDHVSGIVLAGGASRRFGSDKLEAVLEGRSLLGRAVDAVAAVSSEVIVVVAPGDERSLPDHGDVPIRRAVDPEPHGGPLVGLLTGLETAQQPIVVVAGGDMPTLSVDVLVAMVRVLLATEGSTDAAILVRHGVDRPLPAAIRNGAATQAARRLLGEDERSLRALFGLLRTRRIEEIEWRGLDPAGDTLRDVDSPSDLPR
jgi:molybdopterin-guanine dinucleotide biosynthesis protein A